jgi:predicted Rossmann fold nucleotide-binding protein DprA/Smf involved in DNA uptake
VAGPAQGNLLLAVSLELVGEKIYELLSSDQAVHIDDIVERSGLNCSEVLATLFDLEMKGIVRQMLGKQFNRMLL